MSCRAVSTCPAGLPEPSAAEAGLLARGNHNAEQAVRDHKRSADSFIHHHYWSPSVVTGERKEEDTRHKISIISAKNDTEICLFAVYI